MMAATDLPVKKAISLKPAAASLLVTSRSWPKTRSDDMPERRANNSKVSVEVIWKSCTRPLWGQTGKGRVSKATRTGGPGGGCRLAEAKKPQFTRPETEG